MSYKIRTDAERTVQVELKGSYTASEDAARADAGKTDVFITTRGTATVTNLPKDRTVDSFEHGYEVFLPVDSCPGWESDAVGAVGEYCTYELFMVESPTLEAGESAEVDLSATERVGGVPTDRAQQLLADIVGPASVMVSADRVFWNQDLEKFNPTCQVGDGVEWVTYFSEDDTVDACSTEP